MWGQAMESESCKIVGRMRTPGEEAGSELGKETGDGRALELQHTEYMKAKRVKVARVPQGLSEPRAGDSPGIMP